MDFKEIWESFERENRIEKIATEQDVKDYMSVKAVGDKFCIFPPPETREKALEWLEKYYGARQADSLVRWYKGKFPIELRPLQDQLKKINQFIKETDEINSDDAVNGINLTSKNKEHYEYVKWKCGHYKVVTFYGAHSFINDDLKHIYGKYVLYKKWLEEEIKKLTPKTAKTIHIGDSNLQIKNPKFSITIFEKLKRELNIINWIFKSQFMSKSKYNDYPMLHDEGKICSVINIRSNRRLMKFEKYKEHYVKRFENSNTNVVVKNELIEIRKKAVAIRDYYNANLTVENPKFKEFIESYNSNYDSLEIINAHTMIILVDDYYANDVMFGLNGGLGDRKNNWSKREFNYDFLNEELALFCLNILLFIEHFDIERPIDDSELLNLKDKLTVGVFNRLEHPNLFNDETIAEENVKKVTHPIHNPNLWNAKCYDLFKYLYDNYHTNTKRQLTNIWFFLVLCRSEKYKFYATKDVYKEFILKSYSIEIKNVDKAERKWEEKDLPNLKEHLQNFENT